MLDELGVEEGEPGKLILQDKLCHFYLLFLSEVGNIWITITVTLTQGYVYHQLAHVQHHHLVEVHHEELVCGCQLRALARKLSVKVWDILSMPLGMKIALNQIYWFQGLSLVDYDRQYSQQCTLKRFLMSKLKRKLLEALLLPTCSN